MIEPEYLSYRDIEERTIRFAKKHNPNCIVLFPVEEIIEFDLGIDIIPIPNLQKDLDIEGFTSSDLKSIYVDQSVFERRLYRYRFTLAHELGHIELHADILKKLPCDSVAEWKERYRVIGRRNYGWLEWQANCFGGLLLVPTELLMVHFENALQTTEIKRLINFFQKRRFKAEDAIDYLLEKLAERLVSIFDVSIEVLKIRMEKEKLNIKLLQLLK